MHSTWRVVCKSVRRRKTRADCLLRSPRTLLVRKLEALRFDEQSLLARLEHPTDNVSHVVLCECRILCLDLEYRRLCTIIDRIQKRE
jgi:hypothetical protein